jgi:hypothetical protein
MSRSPISFSFLTLFIVLLPLASSIPFPTKEVRGCDQDGVFCLDIGFKEGNDFHIDPEYLPDKESAVRFSLTIQQLTETKHDWILWMNLPNLTGYWVSVNFMKEWPGGLMEENIKYLDLRKHVEIRISKSYNSAFVSFHVFANGNELTLKEIGNLGFSPNTGKNSVTMRTSGPWMSDNAHFEEKIFPVIRIQRIGKQYRDTAYIIETRWINLFEGKFYFKPTTTTTEHEHEDHEEHDDEHLTKTPSAKSPEPSHTWIWILVGLVGLVAVLVLCILIYCAFRYAYVVHVSSQRSTSTSFLSTESTTDTKSAIVRKKTNSPRV